MSVNQYHRMQVECLQYEFVEAGFNLIELTMNPLFRDALREYGAYRLTFDEFMATMETVAILNPRLKS